MLREIGLCVGLALPAAEMGNLVFALQDVRILKQPTNELLFRKQLLKASSANNADDAIQAAQFALKQLCAVSTAG